jgi:pyruvate/2-oxoglutarate/acetoin dehydrogenase E1 component
MEVLLKLLMGLSRNLERTCDQYPICESAVVSAGMGLSINGYKAIVEMQFDFVSTSVLTDCKFVG